MSRGIIWLVPALYNEPESECTNNSKINDTHIDVYLPISKLHSILALANLFAHNNITMHELLCASEFARAIIEL